MPAATAVAVAGASGPAAAGAAAAVIVAQQGHLENASAVVAVLEPIPWLHMLGIVAIGVVVTASLWYAVYIMTDDPVGPPGE